MLLQRRTTRSADRRFATPLPPVLRRLLTSDGPPSTLEQLADVKLERHMVLLWSSRCGTYIGSSASLSLTAVLSLTARPTVVRRADEPAVEDRTDLIADLLSIPASLFTRGVQKPSVMTAGAAWAGGQKSQD